MSDIYISSCASDEPPPLVEGDVDCDGEQEREKIQILVDIRTRLLTGHHTNSTRYSYSMPLPTTKITEKDYHLHLMPEIVSYQL